MIVNPFRSILPIVSLIFGLSALAASNTAAIDLIPAFSASKDKTKKEIWAARDQFVRIEPQDHSEDIRPPPNDHPLKLPADDIRRVLGAIELWKKTILIGVNQETLPIFVESELRVLSAAISKGLATARPEEDITFAITGIHGGLVTRERKAIAGRVFYQAGRLNLIFGDLHRRIDVGLEKDARGADNREDRRLYPFHIGSRAKARPHTWRIASREGLEFADHGGARRDDWLLLDTKTIIAALEKESLPKGLAREREKMRRESQRLNAERRQMREEMARLRKSVREGAGKSVEERLATLDQLKSKRLITDQEYATKRKEILDGL